MMRRDPPPPRPVYVLPEHSKPIITPTRSTSSPRKRKLRKKSTKQAAAGEDPDPGKAIATYSHLYRTLADDEELDEHDSQATPSSTRFAPSTPSSPTTHDTLSALSKLIKQEIANWSSDVTSFVLPQGKAGGDEVDGDSTVQAYMRRMHNLHLSDEEYSTKFGLKALQDEFGEVQIFTPTAVVTMDAEHSDR
jgi:hypothetical protein